MTGNPPVERYCDTCGPVSVSIMLWCPACDRALVPPNLHELARDAEAAALSKGFEPCTWENLPGKLMLVCTEIAEARDAAPCDRVERLADELADIALRLLAVMHGAFVGDFYDRRRRHQKQPPYEPIEKLLWPVFSKLTSATQRWRKDNREDARIELEYAVMELWVLGDRLGIDLTSAAVAKMAFNRTRPALNGNRRTLG